MWRSAPGTTAPQDACNTAGTKADAAPVTGRFPVPGHPQVQVATSDALIATRGGIAVEWHYLPPDSKLADPG